MKKEEFKTLKVGWMAPNGDFYPCSMWDHMKTAIDLYESNYGCKTEKDRAYADDQLKAKGWIGIHFLTCVDHGYLFSFRGHLTQEQKRIIKPVYEEEKEYIVDNWKLQYEFDL